jgi:hypothetical protein
MLASTAYAQYASRGRPSIAAAPWEFALSPYLWLPALEGDLAIEDLSAPDVDTGLEDTGSTPLGLKFGLPVRVEVRKGDLVLTLDSIYVNLGSDDLELLGVKTDIDLEGLNLEFGGGYRLGMWPLSRGFTSALSFEVLAGGRYMYIDGSIEVEVLGQQLQVDKSIDWLEPFIGGQVALLLLKRWTLSIRGDVGGFGVGSYLTWNLVGTVSWRVTRLLSLVVGYRAMNIDFSAGSAAEQFKLNMLLHGPGLGVTFHF